MRWGHQTCHSELPTFLEGEAREAGGHDGRKGEGGKEMEEEEEEGNAEGAFEALGGGGRAVAGACGCLVFLSETSRRSLL